MSASLKKLPTLEEVKAERARRSILGFVHATFPNYKSGWVHELICKELDFFLAEVAEGKAPRLMLFVPPRHGKSELVSRRFPAYALGKYPDLSIIAASYGSDLAARMNRDVQRVIDSDEYARIFSGTKLYGKNIRTVADGSWLRNSDIFEVVGRRGVYRSTGVGGGITGMGADILLIDDPIKDMEQANSATYRQNVWDWYTGVAYTRLMPGGGVIIILTRWHEDDIAGRLLTAAKKGEGDQWRVISFPAIAEQDEACRKEGEPLHSERYSLKQLNNIRMAVGSRVWASLYQQRPSAAEGSIFKREWWKFYAALPQPIYGVIQSWDTAFKTGEGNDYSVCTTWGVGDFGYYLLDFWKGRVEFPELKKQVNILGNKWQPYAVLIEDKASGQSLIQELDRSSRYPILPIEVEKDKEVRAHTATPIIEAGKVYLPENAPWVADYIDSLASFPNGAHDDDVDSTTQALNYLVTNGFAPADTGYGEERATANMDW